MAELIEIEIPESISEYLEPVPGSSPAGIDAVNDPEYFKLNMEIPKAVPDYKRWIELCSFILKEKSKDIKVVTWLAFAFYRTEGIQGLNLGLGIIIHLLRKYGAGVFPQNPAHRVKALQFLAGGRVIKFVENEQVDSGNVAKFTETKKLIEELADETKNILPGNEHIFKPLEELLTNLIQSAQPVVKPVEKEIKKETPAPHVNKEPLVPSPRPETEKKPAVQITQPLLTETDITTELRKTIKLFFEYEEEGTKKQRVPELYSIFGISRMLQWGDLARPADNMGITSIEAPNKVIQGLVKEWFSQKDSDMLISRIESEFIKENSEFRYWLDAQRYVVLSLESKGGNYKIAAEDVKNQLSTLLNRIKDLQQLKFKDKQTAFADSETLAWLNDEIMNRSASDTKTAGSDSSMIVDEAYNDITEEYKKIYNDPPESFEKNLMKMQTDMNNDERRKGKFLRMLNIADYCYNHKEYNLARVMTFELKELIRELKLSQWEPALCVSLWQLHYQINREIMSHNKDETLNQKLITEQEELFSEIAKYNGILALKLTKHKR